jgi:DNA-binding beta-propeller fold protein YncE
MQRRTNAAPFETLESRTLLSAGGAGTFVYLETNNPTPGENAVLAYSENPATGVLTPLSHFKYPTGGTGYENVGSILGPDDSDKEVIASPDGKFLFAVNQGSDTVSVFAVQSNGTLTLLHQAAVPSGGTQPVSLTFTGDRLFVLNRGNSADGVVGTVAPDIASFFVGEDGSLFQVPNATVKLPLNLSTAQVLASADGKYIFVNNFATPANLKVSLANTVEPFLVNGDGTLTAVTGGAAGLPANPPLVLGLVEDPIHHIIYAGRAPTGGVSVFTYSSSGKLSFAGSVASEGLGTCWLNISPDGKFLYATDSGSDALSVYSLANPLKPALVQEFELGGRKYADGVGVSKATTTDDFQFSFDPTGKYLWVVNHTTDPNFQEGNQLHTLRVGSNGLLSETSPVQYFASSLVTGNTHVDGLAVITADGYYGGYASQVFAQTAASEAEVFTADPSKLKRSIDDLLDSAAGS